MHRSRRSGRAQPRRRRGEQRDRAAGRAGTSNGVLSSTVAHSQRVAVSNPGAHLGRAAGVSRSLIRCYEARPAPASWATSITASRRKTEPPCLIRANSMSRARVDARAWR